MTRKSVLRSVRLDDDVWEAVKAMDQSLNQFLRDILINGLGVPLRINISELSGVPNYDPRTGKLLSGKPFKRGPRQKGDKTR